MYREKKQLANRELIKFYAEQSTKNIKVTKQLNETFQFTKKLGLIL